MLRDAKARVLDTIMVSEFQVLVQLLSRIAAGHYTTRDYANDRLREALRLYVIEFPLYRTYITAAGCSDHRDEAAAIEQAINGIDLVVAAEEERMIGKTKRPQPGKGPLVRHRGHLHVGYSGRASSLRTRLRSVSG